jgi:charged multivesicular body protein 4A/B
MWGWFGGASAQKRKDAPKNAILMLRQQLDMLQKRHRHLKSQMEEQDALARKNLATNKAGTESQPSDSSFVCLFLRDLF